MINVHFNLHFHVISHRSLSINFHSVLCNIHTSRKKERKKDTIRNNKETLLRNYNEFFFLFL